jgi:AI-2 transport protein TqsA
MLLSVPLTMVVKIMLENTEDLRWMAILLDARPPVTTRRVAASKKRSPSPKEKSGGN